MRRASTAIWLALLVVAGVALFALWPQIRGIWPAISPPAGDIVHTIETGGIPLTLPEGFSISIFAKDLPGARVMRFDQFGNLWVSQTGEGMISLVEVDRETGTAVRVSPIFKDLRKPHGLVFGTGEQSTALYIAEENKISRIATYSDQETPEKIVDLPAGGNHTTRTIEWLPGFENEKMLVSIGSSCNVCYETDNRRATIQLLDLKTKKLAPYATGLRNSVFMAAHPKIQDVFGNSSKVYA